MPALFLPPEFAYQSIPDPELSYTFLRWHPVGVQTWLPVLVLLFIALWFILRGDLLCLSVCHFVLVFFSLFSSAITSIGEERANLSAFRTFVRFVLV